MKRNSGKQEVLSKKERQAIKQLVNAKIVAVQEKKSFDTGIGSTFDSVGQVGKLTSIPQGDTDSSRQGDHVKLLKGQIWAQCTYADTTNVVRMIIFRWQQDDTSAAPSVGDIIQTASPFSPVNRDNERAMKFSVILDHLFAVSNVGPGIEKLAMQMQLKSQIAFQAAAVTGTGHLYYLLISDSSATTHPGVSFVWRTYYTDS